MKSDDDDSEPALMEPGMPTVFRDALGIRAWVQVLGIIGWL